MKHGLTRSDCKYTNHINIQLSKYESDLNLFRSNEIWWVRLLKVVVMLTFNNFSLMFKCQFCALTFIIYVQMIIAF